MSSDQINYNIIFNIAEVEKDILKVNICQESNKLPLI